MKSSPIRRDGAFEKRSNPPPTSGSTLIRPRRRTQAGSALVFALLISILLAVVGLYLIGARRGVYANARSTVYSAQARALALAGMDDMTVKLAKDAFFPTGVPDEQKVFSYKEVLRDPNDADRVWGTYQCTVDRTRDDGGLLFLLSVGTVGPIKSPHARYRVAAVLNLNTFTFSHWREGQNI